MSIASGGDVPSVLVVEDDAPTRIFLAENLIADRFAPMSVTSAEEALDLLARARPDVAVVDVGLPGRSGLDLVTAIRDGGASVSWDPGMPILLISGQGSPHAAVRAIERGADDFVPKPIKSFRIDRRLGQTARLLATQPEESPADRRVADWEASSRLSPPR